MTLRVTPAEIVARAEAMGRAGLVGVAPAWSRIRLGDVASITNGAAFRSSHFNLANRGMPLIRIRDIRSTETATWYDGEWEPTHQVQPGSLLVGMDGDFKAAIWRGPVGLLNQRVLRLDVNEAIYDSRFLFHALQGYLDAIWTATSSTTVKHLSSRSVADIPLPNPPIDEQRRIVDMLEDHLSRLDAADGWLATALQRIQKLAGAHLHRIFATELDDVERLPIASLLEPGRRVAYGVLQPGPDDPRGVPLVRVGDLRHLASRPALKRVSARVADKFPRTELRGGEVLLSVVGTIGRTGLAPSWLRGANVARAVAVLPIRPEILPEYVEYALREPAVQHHLLSVSHEVARKTLNLEDVRKVILPIPDVATQTRIVARLSDVEASAARVGMTAVDVARRSGVLRRAVLAAAFSGRLTGRAYDEDRVEELSHV